MEAITLGSTLVALGAIGGVLATYYKLKRQFKDEVIAEMQPALLELSNRIALLEKEIEHVKASRKEDVAELTKKLDELRDEVRQQHSQLIELMMKFVPDKKRR